MPIKLGEIVKDSVTGFTGKAISRSIHLNGCVVIQVQPQELNKDGGIIKAEYLHENRLCDDPEKVDLTKYAPLGKEVSDQVTGFKGIAIIHQSYLEKFVHICVENKANRKGEFKVEWFDIDRVMPEAKCGNGGPADHGPGFSHADRI